MASKKTAPSAPARLPWQDPRTLVETLDRYRAGFLSQREAAIALGVSASTVRQWAALMAQGLPVPPSRGRRRSSSSSVRYVVSFPSSVVPRLDSASQAVGLSVPEWIRSVILQGFWKP